MSVADRRRQGTPAPPSPASPWLTRSPDVEPSLSTLTLDPSKPSSRRAPPSATPDSWEDDDDASSTATTPTSATPARPTHDLPSAPPPTPITPSMHAAHPSAAAAAAAFDNPYGVYSPTGAVAGAAEPLTPLRGHFRPGAGLGGAPSAGAGAGAGGAGPSDVRPDKSSAAAARMIAGALGVRRPKESEEGRAYERAVRERERGKREKEKEEARRAEREREEARRAVWED